MLKRGENKASSIRYKCERCSALKKKNLLMRSVPTVTIKKNGKLTADPDKGHSCSPIPDTEIEMKLLKQQMFKEVEGGKNPRDAFRQLGKNITKRARESDGDFTGDELAAKKPVYGNICRTLLRHKREEHPEYSLTG